MAKGYFELAKKKLDDDRPVALSARRRAERLTSDEQEKKRIQSLALTLEGEELAARARDFDLIAFASLCRGLRPRQPCGLRRRPR